MNDAASGPGPVGVVVPAHNAGRFLPETIDSILAQTFTNWRCVVVDDGSSDDTAAIAADYAIRDPRVQLLRQANAGPCVARNRGLAALGEVRYVSFMDADDVWVPGALDRLVTAAGHGAGVIGAHGLAEFIDADGRPMRVGEFAARGRRRLGCAGGRPRPWPVTRPTTFENVVTQSVLFPPGLVLAERSAYERIGGFDERARGAEDWDVLVRLARLGDLAFVDEVILGYRRHDANAGAGLEVRAAAGEVRRRAHYAPENTEEQQAVLRDAWHAAQRIDFRDRVQLAAEDLRQRRLLAAAVTLSRLPLVAARYVRGAPPRPTLPPNRPEP